MNVIKVVLENINIILYAIFVKEIASNIKQAKLVVNLYAKDVILMNTNMVI
jgi:hypothetical protein